MPLRLQPHQATPLGAQVAALETSQAPRPLLRQRIVTGLRRDERGETARQERGQRDAGGGEGSGKLVTLLPQFAPAPLEVSAVYPSGRHVSAKLRTFLDFLQERFQAIPAFAAS